MRAAGNTLVPQDGVGRLRSPTGSAPGSAPGVEWYSSHSLGGLSNYWTAAVPRFAPEDFTDGARLDERYRWPVTYDELVPFYERAEQALMVTAGDPILGVPSGRHPLPPPPAEAAGG